MPPLKQHSRLVFFQEIAKGVDPRGTVSHVPPGFLQGCKLYLSFSGEEIAALFGVSRQAVERKRKTAEIEPQASQEPKHALITAEAQDDIIPPDFCDMPTEDKIAYITRKYDRCIDGQESLTKDQILALRSRLADLRALQAEEIQEGKAHLSNLLNVIMKDFVRDFKTAFEASFSRLKADIASTALDSLWTDPGKLREILEAEDPTILKDSLKHQLLGTVSGLGNDFDIVQLYVETNKKHPVIKEQIEKYLAGQKHEAPRFVGGGSVSSPDSVQGGAQYRQAAKEELRQQAAARAKI